MNCRDYACAVVHNFGRGGWRRHVDETTVLAILADVQQHWYGGLASAVIVAMFERQRIFHSIGLHLSEIVDVSQGRVATRQATCLSSGHFVVLRRPSVTLWQRTSRVSRWTPFCSWDMLIEWRNAIETIPHAG